jgi:predicted rRNA methylase YqxC with S4 and FtsJ domains
MDAGASTAVLLIVLQAGAARVYAIDVGRPVALAPAPRSTCHRHERTNIRYLTPPALPEGMSVVTVTSFIRCASFSPSSAPAGPAMGRPGEAAV